MDQDRDPAETREWLDALDSVEAFEGIGRVDELLDGIVQAARRKGAKLPFAANTAYVNTISPDDEPAHPGDRAVEHKIRSLIRWNAAAIVLRANKTSSELGGHIASFQSAATLYDTGFMHFWHAPTDTHGGDLVYYQGHCSPGIYARAYLEGRLSEEQLLNFRQEVDGKGMPSYPHPWLMPDFWQFPTVSMGLGPLMAIYQARFLKYLDSRGLADTKSRKVWAFMGDGEMDEPELLGAISLGGREHLDNLVFVINCNLQRLDGPVRGNGKIMQELEGRFSRRRLERHQGPVGIGLGSIPGQRLHRDSAKAHGRMRRRRIPGLQIEKRRLCPRTFLREISRAEKHGRSYERRRNLGDDARRPRSTKGLCGLQGGHGAQGAADGHPRQDRQGLRDGRIRRRPDDLAPGQEDERGGASAVSRQVRDSRFRTSN